MMRLSQVRDWTAGELHGMDRSIASVSSDTRQLQPGSLFVALRGERFDGHAFLTAAQQAGAVAALVEADNDAAPFESHVCVPDTRLGFGRLAAGYAAQFSIPRVAITGNAGKTTVKEIVAVLLGEGTLATHGNLNNDIGVPLTLLRFNSEHRRAVIELGANAPGEIAWSSGLVKPNVALITNVTGAHLEGFGSMDGIAQAKAEIFEHCASDATAVINGDDDYATFFAQRAHAAGLKTVTVGLKHGDLYADAVREDAQGCGFVLRPLGLTVKLPLVGRHQISNALMALAAVQALGVDLAEVVPRLADLQPAPGRMNPIACQGGTLIDDSYNANPGSVRAAIAWLAEQPAPRTLVLGAMGELGAGAETLLRELGEYAGQAGIDTLITLPGAEAVANGFGDRAQSLQEFDHAAQRAASTLVEGGTVLVKGSRSAGMEQVVQRLTENGRGH